MYSSLVFLFSLIILILPLGLDTLGISLSLGMKSASRPLIERQASGRDLPAWLRTAVLFSLAEMLMPIVGLLIGAALSSLLSGFMHYLGALLLIGIGVWECFEEGREYLRKRARRQKSATPDASPVSSSASAPGAPQSTPAAAPERFHWGQKSATPDASPVSSSASALGAPQSTPAAAPERFHWGQQLLLALSISLDELAVGFSFGSVRHVPIGPVTLCLFIGLQGFLMALLGIVLGRALRFRLRALKEWSELLSAALLIVLGAWFLFT